MIATLRRLLVGVGVLAALLTASAPAAAIPPGGAGSDTPGTWSTVSPANVTAGGLVSFSVGGFPAGEIVYVKIDDGASCSDTSHGGCVYHSQKIPSSGVVNGSFYLPADIGNGTHWLRFLASSYIDASDPGAGTKGYTNRSNDFTVGSGFSGSTKGGSSSTGAGSSSGTSSSGTTTTGVPTTRTSAGSVVSASASQAATEPTQTPTPPVATGGTVPSAGSGGLTAEVKDSLVVLHLDDRYAGEWTYVYAYSSPTALGWQQVSVDGTVTVPTGDLAAGEHRFAALDADGNLLGWVTAEIPGATGSTAASTTATPETPATGGRGLPVGGIAAVAGAVVVSVAAIVLALRRRRKPVGTSAR
ncbi:hypothetical protein [Propionicicella superfundia]|uniref:hypothetical protein n=1 Tax=Propionicicella superfundia TaxID=348582 RepID=UPI00041C6478|nr:hypothetical protein [Propionicicella superfundia]